MTLTREARVLTFEGLLRTSDRDRRIVTGRLVPLNKPTTIEKDGIVEEFAPGSFKKTGAERAAPLIYQHDRSNFPVGVLVRGSIREEDGYVVGDFRLATSERGNEVLSLIEDEILQTFSIGFGVIRYKEVPTKDRYRHYQFREVRLNEVSLTPFPAYPDAKVLAVRDDSAEVPEPYETPRLDEAEAILAKWRDPR